MIQSVTPQGLKYAVSKSSGKVACCALSVKCGTRAEGDLPEGIAHFVEHCLFKGTQKHSAQFISSALDKLGGELNAYTTKEEIVIHATVLKEDLPKAINLLMEIGTQATFPQDEIEIEKGVVIDEIISYKDSPAEDIFDNFENRFFEASPIGRLTLGTEESIQSVNAEQLLQYYNTHFIPANMAFTLVADLDEKALEKMVLRYAAKYLVSRNLGNSTIAFATQLTPVSNLANIGSASIIKPRPHIFSIRQDKGHHEANVIIGTLAPGLYDSDRLCAVLLSNILGGPASNSLLNANLREKHGWVYAAECAYTQYSDAGLMTISIGCDKANLSKCLKSIASIVEKLKEKELSPAFLKAAKKQLFGQLAISGESKESQALSMGKSLLSFGKVIPSEESRAQINAICGKDIKDLAQRIWDESMISQLIYL